MIRISSGLVLVSTFAVRASRFLMALVVSPALYRVVISLKDNDGDTAETFGSARKDDVGIVFIFLSYASFRTLYSGLFSTRSISFFASSPRLILLNASALARRI